MGFAAVAAGSSFDVGVYVDAPTDVDVTNAVVYALWVRTHVVI
jgi:hypothetical protein